jgi:hypothetical protein
MKSEAAASVKLQPPSPRPTSDSWAAGTPFGYISSDTEELHARFLQFLGPAVTRAIFATVVVAPLPKVRRGVAIHFVHGVVAPGMHVPRAIVPEVLPRHECPPVRLARGLGRCYPSGSFRVLL